MSSLPIFTLNPSPRISVNQAFDRLSQEVFILGNRFDDERYSDLRNFNKRLQSLMSEVSQINQVLSQGSQDSQGSQGSSLEIKDNEEGVKPSRRSKRMRNTPSTQPGSSSQSRKLDFIELVKRNANTTAAVVEEALTAAGGFEEFGAEDGVDLSDKRLGPHLTTILHGLDLLPAYRKLILKANNIGATQLALLAHKTGFLNQLHLLDLSGNGIGGHLGEFFNRCPTTLPQMRTLLLSNCQLRGYNIFAKVFTIFTEMITLDLSSNSIRTDDLSTLNTAFPARCPLTTLNLANNVITSTAMASHNQLLGKCVNLTSLDLSGNDIGDQGLQIFQGLPLMAALKTLKLASIKTSWQAIPFFNKIFAKTPTLENFHFSGNVVGDAGAKAFPVALALLPNLKFVCLSGCGICADDVALFAEMLGKVRHTITMISFQEIFAGESANSQAKASAAWYQYKGGRINFQEWKAIVNNLKGFKGINVLL